MDTICSDPAASRIYTCILVVLIPSLVTILLNAFIFHHIRSSSRRIQPQAIDTLTNNNANQQMKFSSREVALLKQMIFVFAVFIGGWGPIYFVRIINQYVDVHTVIYACSVLLCETALLSVVVHLFIHNHDLRHYLSNKIQHGWRVEHTRLEREAWVR
ncbi:unnamed protein product [Adineta ricciae]|uniref:G-protein coupled receptors family 1 profile domain-containing protein n=1 Tax=Adineta ricciae TaxID=249248 RepID=A0A813S950_ADIRI|nr:unnamed protein product [Adineta ricciae]